MPPRPVTAEHFRVEERKTQYLYGNPGNPFQLTASRATDNTLTTYGYDTSGNLFAFERGGSLYYVACDHLGTPKVVTDNTGAIVKQAEYDAWGVKLSDSAPAFDLPVGFAGGIPEPVTGLVRFGFRDYEPGTGRWVARDPVFLQGGLNLFRYVGNNPLIYVDPIGLSYLYFDRSANKLLLFNKEGDVVGSYDAYNNVTRDSNGPWPPGVYYFSHYNRHKESKRNGPYGSHGIFVFEVPGREGMGIHSGRSGPKSKTLGCIRSSDDEMEEIYDTHFGGDKLEYIIIPD